MKKKNRKLTIKRRSSEKHRSRSLRVIKINRKGRRSRPAKRIRIRRRPRITDPRIARALGSMRREGVSASEAARREKMKLKTFMNGAGRYLYRTAPGKPWKARVADDLRFSMTILTNRGPLDVIVSNSRERKLLSQYNLALRMFRAGEDGADTALKVFEGKTVGGHLLVTDIKPLIELEEAGVLDYEGFYAAIGVRS